MYEPNRQPYHRHQARTEKGEPANANDDAEPAPATVRQLRNHPLTVSGKAVDQNGKPIAGATILLVATNTSPGKVIGKTTTDPDGRYEFRGAELPYYLPIKQNNDYEQGTFQVFGKPPASVLPGMECDS